MYSISSLSIAQTVQPTIRSFARLVQESVQLSEHSRFSSPPQIRPGESAMYGRLDRSLVCTTNVYVLLIPPAQTFQLRLSF